MKLPEPLATQESNGLPNSAVYEAIVRDCADQYVSWAGTSTTLSFPRWLFQRYGLEPK